MNKYLNALLVAVYSSSAFVQIPTPMMPSQMRKFWRQCSIGFEWLENRPSDEPLNFECRESSCSATTTQGHLTYINHWVYC